ncbi:MAG: EAL domain-containing protein [Pseudomonadota bacterium]
METSTMNAREEKPIQLLVIDDDDVDREKILRLLKKVPMHFNISQGASAKEAMALLLQQQFDCAILDYHLQDALATELIGAIKSHTSAPTPIIMISGNRDERVIADVIRDGVFDYLPKRTLASEQLHKTLVSSLKWANDEQQLRAMQQTLADSEQQFHAAFDYAPLGMALIALDGSILQANAALHQLLGYDAKASALKKLTNVTLRHLTHSNDHTNENAQLLLLTEKKLPVVQYEKRHINKYGHAIPTLVCVALLNKAQGPGCFLFQIYDLSERKRYERQLIRLAHFDSLTGLGNRTKLHEEINFLIKKSQRLLTPFAILFGDIDHFKQINDGLGHAAGDHLLKTIAKRLHKELRSGDSVARLGGDEFVILLQNTQKFESVVAVAEKLIQCVKKPIQLNETTVHISMSFGIALYPTDGDDAQTLLRNADSALYDAKEKGRSCYQLYRKELTEHVHNRLLLDQDLRRALDKQEFELYFQPAINLETLEVESAEALIRWNHPKRGQIMPDEFILYAQESGLITRIDEWVIYEACKIIAQWQARNIIINIAVNVSARQFQSQLLVKTIQCALEKYKVSAEQLIVEITEQMFLENTDSNLQQISDLKALNIKISLDDFGVGFSSLSYIIRFAPHYLKIDRSFIAKIGEANEHDEMVRAIIGLSNVIPMKIVGEGVETEHQLQFLKSLGCHFAQGYFFSRPLAADQFVQFLSNYQPLALTPGSK